MARVSLCSLLALVLFASTGFAQPTPGGSNALVQAAPPTRALAGRAPAPSRRMGKRAKDQAVLKSVRKDYSSFLCPDQTVACPVKAGMKEDQLANLADWFKIGFECLDVKSERRSCGGCASLGAGSVHQRAREESNAREGGLHVATGADPYPSSFLSPPCVPRI